MRVVAMLHYSVPYRMAGSETMANTMLQALGEAGHEVHVCTSEMPEGPSMYTHGAVTVHCRRGVKASADCAMRMRPDVLVSHHQDAVKAIMLGKRLGVPSVFIQHNTFAVDQQSLRLDPDLVVFNSDWIARQWSKRARTWMVVNPPVRPSEHETTPGDCVTLVNLSQHKGVQMWSRLARHFPNTPFLGVKGSHGQQITWGHPPNCEIIGQTSNMRDEVWCRTRVLLMPSVYESWGMAGVEAMASGIPVLANGTPGLRESLGGAGIFPGGLASVSTPVPETYRVMQRGAVAAWTSALKPLLENQQAWDEASTRARIRSKELDPAVQLGQWIRAVEDLAGGG